jgi:hypothetical protein
MLTVQNSRKQHLYQTGGVLLEDFPHIQESLEMLNQPLLISPVGYNKYPSYGVYHL